MNFRPTRRPEEAVLDMTPLIDVVFQMLIFFLVTTTFSTSAGIEVDLPRAKTREITHQQEEVVIAMTVDGRILYKGESVSTTRLKEVLGDVAKRDPNMLIILQADANVPHGKVVEVMDLAKSLGLGRLGIATQQ